MEGLSDITKISSVLLLHNKPLQNLVSKTTTSIYFAHRSALWGGLGGHSLSLLHEH